MANGIFTPPSPNNEPIKNYAPNSPEKKLLKQAIKDLCSKSFDIPLIIGGKEIRTGNTAKLVSPSDNTRCFGQYHKATAEHVKMAADAAAGLGPFCNTENEIYLWAWYFLTAIAFSGIIMKVTKTSMNE